MPDVVNCQLIDGFMTKNEVAHLFNRSAQTLHLWIKRENMPHWRLRGDDRDSIRFKLDEVIAWAEQNGKILENMPKIVSKIEVSQKKIKRVRLTV